VNPRRPRSAATADRRSTGNGDDPERIVAAERVLRAGLSELALSVSSDRIDALLALARLLERWAQRINLTGHRDLETIVARLVLDAAALTAALPETPALVDLGSGAGFPGLPLALLRPDCAVLLVESRERRHHFQRAAIRETGIANARALRGRAETLAPEPQPLVIAQAVAEPSKALRWMSSWANPGGWLALPLSESPPPISPPPDVRFERFSEYSVPCGGPRRTLWLGRRAG
jgi:16S rRNA (guanine527-N7)-methyltransferase